MDIADIKYFFSLIRNAEIKLKALQQMSEAYDDNKKISENLIIQQEKLISLVFLANDIISLLDDYVLERVLLYRYLMCYTYEEISEKTDYSKSHIFYLQRKALKKLASMEQVKEIITTINEL